MGDKERSIQREECGNKSLGVEAGGDAGRVVLGCVLSGLVVSASVCFTTVIFIFIVGLILSVAPVRQFSFVFLHVIRLERRHVGPLSIASDKSVRNHLLATAVSTLVLVIAVIFGSLTSHKAVVMSFASFAAFERMVYLLALVWPKFTRPVDFLVASTMIAVVFSIAVTIGPPISGFVESGGVQELEHCFGVVVGPFHVSALQGALLVIVL